MRDFDLLDTNSFKAFWMACETLNFTAAANKSGLTQSGISQHIAKLEKQLGAPLFERVNKKVFLTESGQTLKRYVEEYLDGVERLKEKVQAQTLSLSGTVAYAMPASCLMSPHLPRLLKKRRVEFPDIRLNVHICTNEEIVDKIFNNEIQYGFVTKKFNYPGLKLTPYCQETFVLIASEGSMFKNLSASGLKELPFVHYPGVEVLFERWRQSHYPKSKVTWDALNIHSAINSLSGAITMVEGGVGLTVVPEHCVAAELKEKRVARFFSPTTEDPTSTIYVVSLADAQVPRRVQKILDVFGEVV